MLRGDNPLLELQFQPDQNNPKPFSVTLSFGAVYEIPTAEINAETLFKQADAAMYAAKRAGRDRVATYEPGMTNAPVAQASQA